MKHTATMIMGAALIGLLGCASPQKVAVLEPIGPAPAPNPANTKVGYLQVYSARQLAAVPPDMAEWQWDSEFGRDQIPQPQYQYDPAHTDYSIYDQSGMLVKRVRNARGPTDSEPALVTLPPGSYQVQAQAEDWPRTIEVKLPIVIQAGRTTTAHLVSGWKPRRSYTDDQVVRLPNGDIAGWLAVR